MDQHQEIDNIGDSPLMTVHQADDHIVLPIELTNSTGTCLDQLNTHCLLEIFSSNSLTLTDLCSIAETCTRFKEIGEMLFPKDLTISNAYYDYNSYGLKSKKHGGSWCSIQSVERILKNFGQYISRVSIRRRDKLLNLVAKYCGSTTLERLDIVGLYHAQDKGFTMKLKTVFQRMLALSLNYCDLMTLATYPYISCNSLIELEITKSSGCIVILRNTFPNLEKFTFYGNFIFSKRNDSVEEYSAILPHFLRRHKRLRTLTLSSESVCCSSQLMETIASNCTELTNLALGRWKSPKTSFNFCNINLRKLTMLEVCVDRIDHGQLVALLEEVKSVTTLKLNLMMEPKLQIWSVVSQMPNLRALYLRNCNCNQIPWSSLTQLKALFVCKPFTNFTPSLFLHIIRELTNLEELVYFNNNFREDKLELRSEDFSEISKIVEHRSNVLKLSKNLAKNYVN